MITAAAPMVARSLWRGVAAATATTRRFGTGQDLKAETENFVYRSSMTDADHIFVDPTSSNTAVPASFSLDTPSKGNYLPPWLRNAKTKPQQAQSAAFGGLPETDPAFRTENDSKDL